MAQVDPKTLVEQAAEQIETLTIAAATLRVARGPLGFSIGHLLQDPPGHLLADRGFGAWGGADDPMARERVEPCLDR